MLLVLQYEDIICKATSVGAISQSNNWQHGAKNRTEVGRRSDENNMIQEQGCCVETGSRGHEEAAWKYLKVRQILPIH